jgi:tetratricopeptide (TPR) repeat protein
LGSLGGAFMYRNQYKEAKAHFDRGLSIARTIGNKHNELLALSHLGNYYEKTHQYDTARYYYSLLIDEASHHNKLQLLCSAYGNMAVTFYKEKRFKKAIEWTLSEIDKRITLSDSLRLKDAYFRLAASYEGIGEYEEAYIHLKKYHEMDAALKKREEETMLSNITLNQDLYDKNKQLDQLVYENQIQQLTIKAKNTYLYGTIALFVLIIVAIFIFLQFKQQKVAAKQLKLQQQLLKSQISPHFLFNVFNAIQSCIITRQYSEAERYLRKFSIVIRTFLEKSDFTFTSIEEEINHMQLYLEVEQLRLGKKLNFAIDVDQGLDVTNYLMPSFLAQVYLENAIWHGTAGVAEAFIRVEWRRSNKGVLLSITDNGKGIYAHRGDRTDENETHKSKGMEMAQRRIQLLNRNKRKSKYLVKVVDLSTIDDQLTGTRVEIELPPIH